MMDPPPTFLLTLPLLILISPFRLLSSKCSWHPIDDLHGSDHFPIVTKISTSRVLTTYKPRSLFKTDLANWVKFEDSCFRFSNSFPPSSNINQETSRIHKIIRCAANQSIPVSSSKPVRPTPLWWNSDLPELRQDKQRKWHEFKRNLIQYKKSYALFRRASKVAKMSCFQKFTSSINSSCDTKKIWSVIRRLTGFPSSSSITSINSPRGKLLYPRDIAEEFALYYSNNSSDSSFPSQFYSTKCSIISSSYLPPSALSSSAKLLDANLSLLKFRTALSTVRGKHLA
ncbi:PREDICTED: uncharacterized protein LOC108374580 [Rhagoletis zephyria]|uniref:uncharacterized protein LOC108374580 n=1 Tax=Rhagoletis zephyria TaxID=28612 RepID=UPI000811A002|nr:PREDICTED: uncharacterized protein LOC108374580 [Rhagoletis zephyria]